MPGLALPSKGWKRVLPWILAGWVWGMTLQFIQQTRQRSGQSEVSTEWICIRPSFPPPVGYQGGKLAVKGIWEGVDAKGLRFRCWLQCDSLDRFSMRTALVKLAPIQPSDVAAPFDFAAYLHSKGVVVHAEVLKWGDIVQEPIRHQGARQLSRSWRAADALGLEGPMNWNGWGATKAEQNEQWTQPPFAVWVHRNAFNAKTRSVHSLDNLSSVSTGW